MLCSIFITASLSELYFFSANRLYSSKTLMGKISEKISFLISILVGLSYPESAVYLPVQIISLRHGGLV